MDWQQGTDASERSRGVQAALEQNTGLGLYKKGDILYMNKATRKAILKPGEKAENQIDIVCRGCTMRGRESVWRGYVSSIAEPYNRAINNSYLTFEEEPENRYDPNAVKIVCRGEFFGTAGYVGREFTGAVKKLLSSCTEYRVEMPDTREAGNSEIHLVVFWNS